MKYKIIIIISLIVITTVNAEETWEYKGSPTGKINGIVVRNDTIYCGTVNGIYYLPPNQSTWIPYNEGIGKIIEITCLKMNEKKEIFAGTFGLGIYKLDKFIDNWWATSSDELKQFPFINDISLNGNNIVTCSKDIASVDWSYPRIFFSNNNGLNWKSIIGGNQSYPFYNIALSKNGGIYCSFKSGVNKHDIIYSLDNGITSKTYSTGKYIKSLFAVNNLIFIGYKDMGLSCSDDGGVNWSGKNFGLNANTICYLEPFIDNATSITTLLVGTENGIFKSINNAETWKNMSNGLGDNSKEVYCIAFDENGFAYAGTSGGVYKYKQTFSAINDKQLSPPLILDISPNPAIDELTIAFSNAEFSTQSLSISNSLGIEIKRFEESELIGKSLISFSTDELPSGVYYCTLNNGTDTITKNFVVVK